MGWEGWSSHVRSCWELFLVCSIVNHRGWSWNSHTAPGVSRIWCTRGSGLGKSVHVLLLELIDTLVTQQFILTETCSSISQGMMYLTPVTAAMKWVSILTTANSLFGLIPIRTLLTKTSLAVPRSAWVGYRDCSLSIRCRRRSSS